MATQSLSADESQGNTPAIPDDEGVFTVETPEGQEKFRLIPVVSMSAIPKPPPLTVRQQLRRKFHQFRNRYYAKKLDGTTGTLACGVTWRLGKLPLDYPEGGGTRQRDQDLCLYFDDPRTRGMISGGFHFVDRDFEETYRWQLKDHVRMLSIRQLVPAEPGDPDGFFVMWEHKAKERLQLEKEGAA